jgi:hypothetical protein
MGSKYNFTSYTSSFFELSGPLFVNNENLGLFSDELGGFSPGVLIL